jgi:hypothetical protein
MKLRMMIGAAVLAASSAHAASLTMTRPAALQKDVAAFPKIAAPSSATARRINAALARLDAALPGVIHECRTGSTGPAAADAYWSRKIDVTMAGPRFLSFLIVDDTFCGGAHPNTAVSALVYDLETGRLADWTRLLPPSLTGKVTTQEDMDGARMVRLTSKRLHALYLAGYGATAQGANPDCREAVTDTPDRPPPASVWPDAKAGGLVVQFDVVHVAEACALPVVIPLATLKTEGASADLTSAIAAAHRAR